MLALFVSCSDSTTEPIDKNATKVTVDEIKAQELADKEAYQNFVNERKVKERAKRESS